MSPVLNGVYDFRTSKSSLPFYLQEIYLARKLARQIQSSEKFNIFIVLKTVSKLSENLEYD